MSNRKTSLSFLTGLGVAPEEAVLAAAEAGYDYLGLRLMPAFPGGLAYSLMDEPARVKSLLGLMKDKGVAVFDVEMIRIGPDFDPEPFLPLLDCSAQLGARAVLVAGDDADEGRLTGSFVKLCEAARPFGLSMDLEFMPQSELRDLAAAIRVLTAADQQNQGVIIDTLHVSRARTTTEEIAAVPRKWLHYAQICDAPAKIPESREDLNHAARHERFLPGEGELDLVGMFEALPADIPVAVEIPNDRQSAGLSATEWARRALRASQDVLAKVAGEAVA